MVQFSISYYFQSEKFMKNIREKGGGGENEYAD